MYNEQLEKLIDYALADGELTEKEKQVLFKKAESMGVDLDEFEMVLDARLFEKQKGRPASNGGVAQLGEHLPCKQGVKSSNLSISIGRKQLSEDEPAGDRRT